MAAPSCHTANGYWGLHQYLHGYSALSHCTWVLGIASIRTLRYGDYGLRTKAGSHFQDWDETRVFPHPTVASSRRCVVEGFYVVWKGGLRIRHKGMKKQFKVRKLRNSCFLTLELQTNACLEQLQVLMNSDQRKMYR